MYLKFEFYFIGFGIVNERENWVIDDGEREDQV